ncbi:transcriptional regulator [Streptomyces aidingensis]|nr:transcriptional regulator [Streptomyces aidingensis]
MTQGPEHGADLDTTQMWQPTIRALTRPEDPVDEPPSVAGVRQALRAAVLHSRHAEYAELAAALPPLIRDAQTLAGLEPEGQAVHTRLMQLVGSVLVQHRQFDIAETVVESTLDAAQSHTQAATIVKNQCWLHLRRGQLAEARELAVRWADEIEPRRITRATPEELAAWGWMLMYVAAAAARDNRRGEVRTALRWARVAAEAMEGHPEDPELTFSVINVQYKAAECAAVRERPEQVLSIAEGIPRDAKNGNSGRRHLLDVASAQAQLRQRDEAVGTLWEIWEQAPEWLSQQRYATDIMAEVVARRRRLTPQMQALARAVRLRA